MTRTLAVQWADEVRKFFEADGDAAISVSRSDAAAWVSVSHYCELHDLHRQTVYKFIAHGLLRRDPMALAVHGLRRWLVYDKHLPEAATEGASNSGRLGPDGVPRPKR